MISFNNKHSRYIAIALLLASIFVFVNASMAVNSIDDVNKINDNQQQQTDTKAPSLFWNFVKLVAVLGIIVAAAWSVIHFFSKQTHAKMQGSWLHIVDEVMLGQNRGVVLCEISGKLYALGVTDGQINLLFEVNNPELIKEISEGDFVFVEENNNSAKSIVNKIISYFFKSSSIPLGGKGFHSMMQEQSQKIKGISLQNIQNRGLGAKKDGEEKQL